MAAKRSAHALSELKALYATPPKAFIAARNKLVAELKKDGRDADAKAVKALKRPDAAAYLVNALAQKYPADVKALLDTADKVSKAQRGGHVSDLHSLSRELRSLTASLLDRGEQLAKEGGVAFTTALRAKLETTFRSANQDKEAREKVLNGVLEHELEATGFEGLFGAGAIHGKAKEKEKDAAPRAPKGPSKQLEQAAKKAEQELAHAERELRRAEQEQGRVQERAEEIQKELARTQTLVERARKHVDDARERRDRAKEKLGHSGHAQSA